MDLESIDENLMNDSGNLIGKRLLVNPIGLQENRKKINQKSFLHTLSKQT
jgi:hypothetical protein